MSPPICRCPTQGKLIVQNKGINVLQPPPVDPTPTDTPDKNKKSKQLQKSKKISKKAKRWMNHCQKTLNLNDFKDPLWHISLNERYI